MKNELIEITIENINIEKFYNEVKKMKIKNIEIHKPILKKGNDVMEIIRVLEKYGTSYASFNIDLFKIFDIELDNVILLLEKSQINFLTLVLNEATFNRIGVEKLWNCISILSKRLDGSSFYCGMEPSSDEKTRYFTNNELGPLLSR